MEKVRKRIRILVLSAVLFATACGILYYYSIEKEGGTVTEGTLITVMENGGAFHVFR